MIGIILVLIAAITLVAVMLNPKFGAVLVWPIILLYPHLYWYELGYLPWNIGIDDLFICVFFLAVVLRRNFLGGVPVRLGLPVWAALAYVVIWSVANYSGWNMRPDLLPEEVLKPILKGVVFLLFTYALVHCIDNERDLKRQSHVFVFVLALAAITVILHKLLPAQMVIFTSGRQARLQAWYGEAERAVGSLETANTGCALMAMAALFILPLARGETRPGRKALLWLCLPVLLTAMVLTGSRTGALAFSVGLLAMAVLSRSRWQAATLLGGLSIVVLATPQLFADLWERIQSTLVLGTAEESSAYSRIEVWQRYWETATGQVWFLGQGRLVPTMELGLHPHSTYVSALFVHGIWGFIWLVLVGWLVVRRGLWLVRNTGEPYRRIASSTLFATLVWAVAGLTLDMLATQTPRFVLLGMVILLDRTYALARRRGEAMVPAAPARPARLASGGFIRGAAPAHPRPG
jgi:hypothetical protein